MAYVLVFDMRGNGRGRRRLDRYLRRTAHKVQHSAWEFDSLSSLKSAARLVVEGGGRAMAFSRRDELLLHSADIGRVLKRLLSC